jgi:CheY-like chemotaxis protein
MSTYPLIVLIEDDPADMELTVRAVERAGLTARLACFSNAPTAVAWLRDLASEIELRDCVLLSDRPGQIAGRPMLDVLAEEAQLADLRTVVLTGSRELTAAELRASVHQPVAVLTKPLDIDELRAALAARKPALPSDARARHPAARRQTG